MKRLATLIVVLLLLLVGCTEAELEAEFGDDIITVGELNYFGNISDIDAGGAIANGNDTVVFMSGDGTISIHAWANDTVDFRSLAGPPTAIYDTDNDTKVDLEEAADEDHVRMDVGGTEAFILYPSGILSLPQQSAAQAYFAASQSIPDASYTRVNWTAEGWDTRSELNLTTDRFTATEDGVYATTFKAHFLGMIDTEYMIAYIKKNGDYYHGIIQYACTAQGLATQVTGQIWLDAGDYLEAYVLQNDGGGANNDLYGGGIVWYTWWEIAKVS